MPRERMVASADKKVSFGKEMFAYSSIRQCTGTGRRPLCTRSAWRYNVWISWYSTPNDAARDLIEDEDLKNSKIAFPDLSQYSGLETFTYLGEDGDSLYNDMWKEVKSN